MQSSELKSKLDQLGIELDSIREQNVKEAIYLLFNIIEELSSSNGILQEENQKLRDEINHLKGEQGKPEIRPQTNFDAKEGDISSEKERADTDKKKKKKRDRDSKVRKIKITRTIKCEVAPGILPADAEYKGHESVVVQDLKIEPDNIEFQKKIYYSPSLKKTYRGQLPAGYEGEFGPTIRSLTIIMKYACNMSEPKILEFFSSFNIHISGSSISNILIKKKDDFHKEKKEIYHAGLCSMSYQQIDDTSARVNGENYYTHIMCNDLYTAYFTRKRKDRLTIIDILRCFRDRKYFFNNEAFDLLKQLRISQKVIGQLKSFAKDKEYREKSLEEDLSKYLPKIGKIQKARILEAGAIASYHHETGYPVVETLICDDAAQFKLITKNLGLCWVHDGRHYKKLRPIVPHNEKKLEEFRKVYWEYYNKLIKFKEEPTEDLAQELSLEFDKIFSTKTCYEKLDERISKSKGKKDELLMVLKYPEIPLHNNEAELGARVQVRRRDVSLQTKTSEGTEANDTFMTIFQTAKKLGVNVYEYIFDRVTKKLKLPSLADIIKKRTLGGSELEYCDSG